MKLDVNSLISLEEAQRSLLKAAAPLASEVVLLTNARGRVLAENVRACRDEPECLRVAMDGYGVCSADVETATAEGGIFLPVVGTVSAGERGCQEVRRGVAVRVMTGTTLPKGADAVVPEELTETVAEGIRVIAPVGPGDHIIPVGAEYRKGQLLMSSGTVLRPAELTVVAALGYTKVTVRRKPRVAVLATGDELAAVGESLGPEEVFASNLHTLTNLVENCGCTATPLGIAPDSLDALMAAIERGMEFDVVITTGGSGRGEKDLVSVAVAALGGEFAFQGVAMRPGKQSMFAKLGKTLMFGLPGRPSAAHIAFEQLVRPVLLRMLGISHVLLPEIGAELVHPLRVRGQVLSFLLCRLVFGEGAPLVRPLRSETEGILPELLTANGLLKVPPGRKQLEAGESVRVQLLDLGLDGFSYFAVP
ncbi:MAG: molybdopterin molybdotransferase MoeA [Deltaproteobacteria bacterium]|nr:MAG: molybdopterin molybdotransferase MoeA [Deltaproteobacteria bacterium]